MATHNQENIQFISLEKLRLAPDNPRFGNQDHLQEQKEILSNIITNYGIDDVLGSIARNGYFSAEPLICTNTCKQTLEYF